MSNSVRSCALFFEVQTIVPLTRRPLGATIFPILMRISPRTGKSNTRPIQVRNADILVSAAGRAGLVKGHWIRPGAVVVDVAMNTVGEAGGSARAGVGIGG